LLNLYLLRLDYDLRFVGLVNAAGQLLFAVSSLLAGLVGRRWGNRRMMIVGMGLAVAGYGLLPLVRFPLVSLESIWLVVTYSLAWFGLAQMIVNMIPYLMDATGPEERTYVFSMVGAILALSGFLGGLVAGLLPGLFAGALGVTLDEPTPYRYPLLIPLGVLILGFLALLATRDAGTDRQQETVAEAGLDRIRRAPLGLIAVLTLVMFLVRTGEGAARTFFNVYLDVALRVSTALIASFSATGQLLAVPAALAAPLLIARFGLGRTIVVGNLGIAVCLLPLAFIPLWGAAGLGYMGVIVLLSITVPAFGIYHQEIMPIRWRTVMSGAATMAIGLSWSVTTSVGGYVITNLGYQRFFFAAAVLTASGGLLFWAYFRIPRGELAHSAGMDSTISY
jgi:predicted MFS family arabinose efflux permease